MSHPRKVPASSGTLSQIGPRRWLAVGPPGIDQIEFRLPAGPVFVLDEIDGQRYVLPGDPAVAKDLVSGNKVALDGKGSCWVLPESPFSSDAAWMFEAGVGSAAVSVRFEHHNTGGSGTSGLESRGSRGSHAVVAVVTVDAPKATLTSHAARPHADVHGREYLLHMEGGRELSEALAGFYWGTMLPCVVERTAAANYPDASGFVISTLADKYVGTYPDVDHEFQIKGRLAAGSPLDLHVVRRMMELQFRMMREDPCGLWRDPCAVQPSGDREYHVRRNSMDRRENAVMFLITGNVEVIESAWLYVARTADKEWLKRHMDDLEGALSCVESCIDPLGRLWSDVYYEDQVIKDGRETMAAALAIQSFELMAELECLLDRRPRAEHYEGLAKHLGQVVSKPLPLGCWDESNRRFIDWVDRSGAVHDHIHLLANELPVMFGVATDQQAAEVDKLLGREEHEFQRFPSFLAARIQDYTESEIGDGGPYDLCAAGRYWCWDAAFWSWRGRGDVVLSQLRRVAKMGKRDDYVMGERYDMNHVYYRDGPPWHGAAHYYEYPCVFAWVLVNEYLGIRPLLGGEGAHSSVRQQQRRRRRPGDDAEMATAAAPNLRIAPRLVGPGSVTLRQEAYQLHYEFSVSGDGGRFGLRNDAPNRRRFELDLRVLFPRAHRLQVQPAGLPKAEPTRCGGDAAMAAAVVVELEGGGGDVAILAE